MCESESCLPQSVNKPLRMAALAETLCLDSYRPAAPMLYDYVEAIFASKRLYVGSPIFLQKELAPTMGAATMTLGVRGQDNFLWWLIGHATPRPATQRFPNIVLEAVFPTILEMERARCSEDRADVAERFAVSHGRSPSWLRRNPRVDGVEFAR